MQQSRLPPPPPQAPTAAQRTLLRETYGGSSKIDGQKLALIPMAAALQAAEAAAVASLRTQLAQAKADSQKGSRRAGLLGVVRLDYRYPPSKGDIDHPDSFAYDAIYLKVQGLTFEMCQMGRLPPDVEARFIETIVALEKHGVNAITGDCGFMMYFQPLARRHTRLPVFLSALVQLPAVISCYAAHEVIAILTANGRTLEPMRSLINHECGIDIGQPRYLIVGCEKVAGFDAVARGARVDYNTTAPGIVSLCKQVLQKHPGRVRCFLLECTELPMFADDVRAATGLPVFDAITAADFFMSAVQDNVRFGKQGWQEASDTVPGEAFVLDSRR